MKRRLFVVVHAQSFEHNPYSLTHAVSSAQIAYENSADGVFLIPDYENERTGRNFRAKPEDLFVYFREIKKVLPFFPVGVNFLSRFESIESSTLNKIKNEGFDMIQSDGSFANTLSFSEMNQTEFFTGIAFKYSRYEGARGEELKRLCEKLPAGANIIPTTSGPATGQAADLEKIREIRLFLTKERRLGIASGITLENVQEFLSAGVTDFLVATSLKKETLEGYDMLDPVKVSDLAERIHT